MLYLDTAALVKLVHREQESDALSDWLAERMSVPWLTSVIAEVELARALRRSAPAALSAVPALLARLHRCELDEVVRATAAALPGDPLRSLDAIHLATAAVIAGPALQAFVTYDRRLAEHARAHGLVVTAPA
ncbi:type II toxin-antitoxin system VapC family toxin [Actinomycetospora sp. NBRC 106378]|uniref:type II toxin-antitoxin system VapC family toxin n=1 Tax=Actinomycetospora sp. NBRC 106378 TaxID=3032208 RepID=UPI0024A0A765|nr:type II toxin-antitoxin system VapC family toxin [Actinomycetospora sp. NBRC 106378]GLZ54082.1 ribonuclease VapC35 [Actinomycetospora sp. NBRC 106378]